VCDDNDNQTYWEADVDPFTRKPLWDSSDLRSIRKTILVPGEMKIIHNEKFDVPMLDNILPGLMDEWPWDYTHDTLISGHLINSNEPHDLTSQVLIHLGLNIKPVEDKLHEATAAARRMCRTKAFIAQFGQWRIAEKGEEDLPSAKDATWQFDTFLPRMVAKYQWEASDAYTALENRQPLSIIEKSNGWEWRPPSEVYEGYHPWWTVLSEYANPDSGVLCYLAKAHHKCLHANDLWSIYLERMKLVPQLCAMESRGATLHQGRMTELEERFTKASEAAGRLCKNIASRYDNYKLELPKNGMNNSLRGFLFDTMRLESPIKTDSGAPSFDKNVIEHFMLTLPTKSKELTFVEKLREKRSADTALGYLTSYRKYMLPDEVMDFYLIHSKVNPTGTATLRNSSQDPNSQQVSKKEGFNLRYVFGPLPGREWWSIDYDNLELRIPAYESGERVMIDIFEKPNDAPYFGSYHLLNASIVYPDLFWPLAEKKGAFKEKYGSTYYQWIKNFDFADQYGAMLGSGTADLAAHKPGAQAMVQARLKEKNKLNNKYIDLANKWGFVETIPDIEVNPRRGYPVYCSRSKWGRVSPTIPLNYHVQSTACWIKMRAMFKVEEYLRANKLDAYIILEIHDELIFDFPFVKDKGNLHHLNAIRKIMASLGDCVGIPLTCGLSYHPHNWAQAS
jgi:hypothetical protein